MYESFRSLPLLLLAVGQSWWPGGSPHSVLATAAAAAAEAAAAPAEAAAAAASDMAASLGPSFLLVSFTVVPYS